MGIRTLAAAAAAFVVLAPLPALAHSITYVERATTDVVTDTGAKDDSAGDILTFANELYDKSNKTKVGTDNGYCIRTVAGKAWECAWTNVLQGGQISVQGTFLDGQDSLLTITGGTGKYNRIHGDMLLHARDAKGSEYDFTFNLR